MGRPTKLTPEVQARIVEAIAGGNYLATACAYAGLSYETFRLWMERGRKESTGRYHVFVVAVTRAELEAEATMLEMWRKHMPQDYRAIRDFLERRHPDRWRANRKPGEDSAAMATLALEEARLRVEKLKAEIAKLTGTQDDPQEDDGFLDALNASASRVWGNNDSQDEV